MKLEMSEQRQSEMKLSARWLDAARRATPVMLVYLLATSLTDAHFMADTADYVDSIAARASGTFYDYWEFGHLFWRPLGWLFYKASTLFVAPVDEAGMRAQIVWTLLVINWLAGLVCVLCLYGLVRRISKVEWVANVVTIAFICSQGFLNFAQTGCSYVPGLMMLLLGLWLLTRGGERNDFSWRTAALAGTCLAVAVCFWVPYLWAIPAALALPLLLYRMDAERKRLAWRTAIVFVVVVGLSYAAVLAHLGIYSVAGVRAWIASASHGNETRGLMRMVFGLSRSFINMGNDGVLFKRYLLHDPFNPVTTIDLFRLSLWKIGLFYCFLLAVILNLLRSSEGKRVFTLLLVNAIPVLAFATLFDGGAIERYLPLYPLLFISLGYSLSSGQSLRWPKVFALAFVAILALVNASVMAKITLNRQQEASVSRIKDLEPLLKPHSVVLTATWLDDLINFNRSFPLHAINRRGGVVIGALVTPGTSQSEVWRQEFASRTLKAWDGGNDVWVSKSVFSERPPAVSNWTEGDDRHVSWHDFNTFFANLKVEQAVGGEDGFVLIAPSLENREFLESFVQDQNKTGSMK